MAKKNVTKKVTTKEPSGLSIKREGSNFIISWKIADSDYARGQQLQVRINGYKWEDISGVGVKTTTKAYAITPADFFPNTSRKLLNIDFRIRGWRKDEVKETSTTITTYTYRRSAWATKRYTIAKPNTPTLTATLSESEYNVTTFAWDTKGATGTDATWFTDVVYQTILVQNCQSGASSQNWSRSATGWGTASGLSATGSTSKTEVLANVSKTRFFRVKARGPAGETDWRYAQHVYARPREAEITSLEVKDNTGGYQVTMKWKAANTKAHPLDKAVVQYADVIPGPNMTCPSGANWNDVVSVKDTDGTTAAAFIIDTAPALDHAIFFRIMTEHDPYDTSRAYCEPVTNSRVIAELTPPSNLSVTHISGKIYEVSATNNCEISDSHIVISVLKNGSSNVIRKGVIPAGSTDPIRIKTSASTETGFSILAQAEAGSGGHRTLSDRVEWDSGQLPTRPENLTLSDEGDGTVLATWTNTWDDTEGLELTWSRERNAWESTKEPESFSISGDATRWYVADLEVGTWYFRVRATGDSTVSPWSKRKGINLAKRPAKPIASLSAGKIGLTGNVTVSWNYTNEDNTEQACAEICQATMNGSAVTSHAPVIALVETAHSATIYAEDLGWTAGEHHVCVRVTSSAGKTSYWSEPVTITVADPPTATISATSLTNMTIVDDGVTRTVKALTAMPFTVTVTGADAGGITTVSVERAETYHMDRPNGDEFDGYDEETIAIIRQTGDAQISISDDDLLGRLDDGAKYRIVAEVTDSFGQSARVTMDFEVHWSHQAVIPTATIQMDNSAMIAKITPIQPTGAATGDVCDIYRLSADKPELIFEGASWGTTYVDPYPTIGEFGGHRVVLRTANGDYITQDNQPAWTDYDSGDGDIIELEHPAAVIDFGGNQAVLTWNMKVNSNWDKDFTETQYLGGTVQGDWNAAVSRKTTIGATVLKDENPELIRVMRRLADYAGICHVRTPEGSSFAADVQVTETSGPKYAVFSLAVTRIDPEGFDGMTLAQWEEEAAEQE